MRYELDRLGPDSFEHLIQSLLRGIAGNSLSVFGDGPDGQREATIEGAEVPINDSVTTHGYTIIQAKFKSPDTKKDDWMWLQNNLKSELDRFRTKAYINHDAVPETWLFFTNIVLTPVFEKGIHDHAERLIAAYKDIIPEIHVFGADDIRAMLENNRDVAQCYAGFIMPGDVLLKLQKKLENEQCDQKVVNNRGHVYNQQAETVINIERVENLNI